MFTSPVRALFLLPDGRKFACDLEASGRDKFEAQEMFDFYWTDGNGLCDCNRWSTIVQSHDADPADSVLPSYVHGRECAERIKMNAYWPDGTAIFEEFK